MGPQQKVQSPQEPESSNGSPSHKKWVPTQQALEKLLAALDSDPNKAAWEYEKVRAKLLRYFERYRYTGAEQLIDETLDRVMRRLDEGETIINIMAFIYKVASYVRMEQWKEDEQLRNYQQEVQKTTSEAQWEVTETPRQLCFDECLDGLPVESRVLIHAYYSEEGSAKIRLRKQMAAGLGIELNALRIRAHRIRMTLETCVNDCVSRLG